MAVNITISTRCTNKTLFSSTPPGGGPAVDSVNATLVVQQSTANTTISSGNIILSYPLANDLFLIGNFYDVTIVDGVAPTAVSTSQPGTAPPMMPSRLQP